MPLDVYVSFYPVMLELSIQLRTVAKSKELAPWVILAIHPRFAESISAILWQCFDEHVHGW